MYNLEVGPIIILQIDWQPFFDGFRDLANDHGLLPASIVALIAANYATILWLMKKVLKSKNAEIDRLVEERNWLQERLFPGREGSQPEQPDPGPQNQPPAKKDSGKKQKKKGRKK